MTFDCTLSPYSLSINELRLTIPYHHPRLESPFATLAAVEAGRWMVMLTGHNADSLLLIQVQKC